MFATAIAVSSAKDAGEASEKAKREFERLEDVPNWKYHAQFLEVERENTGRVMADYRVNAAISVGVRRRNCSHGMKRQGLPHWIKSKSQGR